MPMPNRADRARSTGFQIQSLQERIIGFGKLPAYEARRVGRLLISVALVGLLGCYSGGRALEGWVQTRAGSGPQVNWDVDVEPIPEVPLPNDIATRPDPTSPTGRRLNISRNASTSFERKLRGQLDQLDGFGTFAPLWLSFDQRIDLRRVAERQTGDTTFDDDVVLLINVTKASPEYGQALVLDFGNGSYPLGVTEVEYFENDPRAGNGNLILDVFDEDAFGDGDGHCDVWEDNNQNGVLDPGEDLDGDGRLDTQEDTDNDGVCDEGNLWGTVLNDPNRMHPYFDLLSFYELETETLFFRPLTPMDERTTYAVVIMRDLIGENGEAVRSPFPYVHHLQQTAALKPIFKDGLLERYGRTKDDVAFAWTFTTQSILEGFTALRNGLDGEGPFAYLQETYPAEISAVAPVVEGTGVRRYNLKPVALKKAFSLLSQQFAPGPVGASGLDSWLDTYGAVDYILAGDYISPDFVDAAGGSFDLNPQDGTGSHQGIPLRFLAIVPKSQYGTAPFPTVLYAHGYTSVKLEALAFAGVLAKFGLATVVIDAYGHGLPMSPELKLVLNSLLERADAQNIKPFFDAIQVDRARDLNGDGLVDPAGDFWTNDMFHTRDIIRQTVLDYMQLLRVVRGFDGERRMPFDLDGDGTNELAGDFNADGVVDFSGPFYAMGTSNGGILSSILGAIEPDIVACAPVSSGGGLLEIGLRTDLVNVKQAVMLPVLGPMIITEPLAGNRKFQVLKWLVSDLQDKRIIPFAMVGRVEGDDVVDQLQPGDIIRVENITNGETAEVRASWDLRIRAHLPSDKGDAVVVEVYRPDGSGALRKDSMIREDATLVKRIDSFEIAIDGFQAKDYAVGDPLVAIQEGLGRRNASPELRRLVAISQIALEPGDPINYARYYNESVQPRSGTASPANVLFTVTLGDMTVPVSAGIALARAAGVIGYLEPDPRYGISQNDLLIRFHVADAIDELRYFAQDCCYAHCGEVNFDIDNLSNGNAPENLPNLVDLRASDGCGRSPPDCSAAVCEVMPPLRATVKTERGIRAVRFPALNAKGMHAIGLPNPEKTFDGSMFVLNQIGYFLKNKGKRLSDNPCLAKNDCRNCLGDDCPEMPPPPKLGK